MGPREINWNDIISERYPCCVPFKNGLARWAKQIENGVYLINGQVKDEDGDLLEGQVSWEKSSLLMKLFVLEEK